MQRTAPPGISIRFSPALIRARTRDSYQGTTSVVPQVAENMFGFSRCDCGSLSIKLKEELIGEDYRCGKDLGSRS
jgi:hypothetical protein